MPEYSAFAGPVSEWYTSQYMTANGAYAAAAITGKSRPRFQSR